MSETLDPSLSQLNDCGCCAGITAETPATVRNREGLEQIQYRVGTHGLFRHTLLAALSEAKRPKLHELTTRADDDFSIALLDAWATTADVLAFYQERLANESYLGTATDHGSVLRLARLIGYELKPAVAATTWLAFTLETAPGSPEKVAIAAGAKVQSVPGQDEKPQMFETMEGLEARAEWNAMRPQVTAKRPLQAGDTCMYLRGTATQLQPGDAILIAGAEREQSVNATEWSVRVLVNVVPNTQENWTRVTFNKALEAGRIPQTNVQAFAFRQRASQFGHNAPDPTLIAKPDGTAVGTWPNFKNNGFWIDLDSAYPKIVSGSWLVLVGFGGGTMLYRADSVSFPSRSEFALSGKVTRIKPDKTDSLTFFGLLDTLVYAQSELIEIADPPLTLCPDAVTSDRPRIEPGTLKPVAGERIILDHRTSELPKGRTLIVAGKRSRARVAHGAPAIVLTNDAHTQMATLQAGDTLIVMNPPAVQPNGTLKWRLRHDNGFDGTLTNISPDWLKLTAARTDDPVVSEPVTLESSTGNPTEIVLGGTGLQNIYDRGTVTIAANVVRATHGETVEEIAGSGDAAHVFQSFTLRQSPLTFVRAGTASGLASTLEVRVDDLLWHRVPFLYRRKPEERIYIERLGDGEKTTIHFGDGITGRRLSSGQQNVRLKYRKGSGLEGLVKAGQLTQLLTRPLGVKDVINPLPAEGADEAESLSDARRNAPLTVLTLQRVVSLQDYEDFAGAYPGIAKALATWTWDGRKRGVYLTVAGPHGAAVAIGPGSVGSDLADALRAAGDPFVPLRIETYRPATFKVAGNLTVHPDYEKEKVLAAARDTLRSRFSFAARAFGQPLLLSEVIGVLHSVKGVVAVDVDHLQRTDKTEPEDPAPRLLAEFPGGGAGLDMQAAELLLLAPGNLEEIKAAS